MNEAALSYTKANKNCYAYWHMVEKHRLVKQYAIGLLLAALK